MHTYTNQNASNFVAVASTIVTNRRNHCPRNNVRRPWLIDLIKLGYSINVNARLHFLPPGVACTTGLYMAPAIRRENAYAKK